MKMSRIIIAEKAEQCHNVTRGVGINCSKTTPKQHGVGICSIVVQWLRFPLFGGRIMVYSHCTGPGMGLVSMGFN